MRRDRTASSSTAEQTRCRRRNISIRCWRISARGDYLILQNEVNLLDYIIDRAYDRGMKIVLNPSPFDEKLDACDLTKIYLFMLNEIEGEQFTGSSDKDEILDRLAAKFPNARFVLTLGSDGAVYYDGKEKVVPGYFQGKGSGYHGSGRYLYRFLHGPPSSGEASVKEALRTAAKASSIAVSRPGATPSIPTMDEVRESLKD